MFKIAASNKKGEAYMNLFDENETSNFGDARIINKIKGEDIKRILKEPDNSFTKQYKAFLTNYEKVSVSTLDELFFHEFNEKKS